MWVPEPVCSTWQAIMVPDNSEQTPREAARLWNSGLCCVGNGNMLNLSKAHPFPLILKNVPTSEGECKETAFIFRCCLWFYSLFWPKTRLMEINSHLKCLCSSSFSWSFAVQNDVCAELNAGRSRSHRRRAFGVLLRRPGHLTFWRSECRKTAFFVSLTVQSDKRRRQS